MAESSEVGIIIDGRPRRVRRGDNLASALLTAGTAAFRCSVTGEPRVPLCAMGTCHECRVTVDGRPHVRSCLVIVAEGMTVETVHG